MHNWGDDGCRVTRFVQNEKIVSRTKEQKRLAETEKDTNPGTEVETDAIVVRDDHRVRHPRKQRGISLEFTQGRTP